MSKLSESNRLKFLKNHYITQSNRIRMELSLHNLETWGEVCNVLNYPVEKCGKPLDSKLTIREFNDWYKSLEAYALAAAAIEPPKFPSKIIESPKVEVDIYESILPPRNPAQLAYLFPFQDKDRKRILYDIIKNEYSAGLLNYGTGYGKTFVGMQLCRDITDLGWCKDKSYGPYPIMIVTKSPIIEQTQRVGELLFGLKPYKEFIVTSYDQLRSSWGKGLITLKEKHTFGEVEYYYEWNPFMNPAFIWWDEAHAGRHEGSKQSQVMQAFNEITTPTYQLFSTATAFLRVCEAKCFAVATKVPIRNIWE